MLTRSIAQARLELVSLSKTAAHGGRFILTNHGRPESVLIGAAEYARLTASSTGGPRAIILAAGGGRRPNVGHPCHFRHLDIRVRRKNPVTEKSVSILVRKLRSAGIHRPAVVTDADMAESMASHLDASVSIVPTKKRNGGFSASLKRGIRFWGEHIPSVLVVFASMPGVRVSTLRKLLRQYAAAVRKPCVLSPVYRGRSGHPVLLDRRVLPDVLAMDPRRGLAAIFRKHRRHAETVCVDDPRVLDRTGIRLR